MNSDTRHASSHISASANGVITVSTDTSVSPKNNPKDAVPASPSNNALASDENDDDNDDDVDDSDETRRDEDSD